jgi:hypothetical protein
VDSVPIDPNCDWGPQEINAALAQAQEFEDDDDLDSANLLRAQAQAMKAKLDGVSSAQAVLEPFDPMRTNAQLLYHYKGLTWHALKEMDHREYFGYVRELSFILEEQSQKPKNNPKQSQAEVQAALNQFPQPETYTGETIQLI